MKALLVWAASRSSRAASAYSLPANGAVFSTSREGPVIRRAHAAQLSHLVRDEVLHLRVPYQRELYATRLGLEFLGGAQPQIPDCWIPGALGEVSIPGCQLAPLFRIRHDATSFVMSRKIGKSRLLLNDLDQSRRDDAVSGAPLPGFVLLMRGVARRPHTRAV